MVTYGETLVALSDPTRREVFERIAKGTRAMSVSDLAEGFTVSRPAVSQHLKVLKEAGLVVDRRDGTRRLYQVNPAGIAVLREYLDRFWDDALAGFKRTAESERGSKTRRDEES